MNTKTKVVGLVISDPTIIKTKDNCGRNAFGVFGEYLLEDGTKMPARLVSTRKKDVPDRIERCKRDIAEGCLHFEGPFLVQTFRIGPKLMAA
jgi:hypothetical protein